MANSSVIRRTRTPCGRFWQADLTEAERASVRHFLGSQEYDTTDEELMLNEMQAYLMFTRDPRFFKASDIGMTEERRAELPGRIPAWSGCSLAAGEYAAPADWLALGQGHVIGRRMDGRAFLRLHG